MSDARRTRLLNGPILATLAALAAPNIAASFIQSSISIVEGVYLGLLGTVELAGAALVFPLFMLTTMYSSGAIGGAVAGMTARAVGAGDRERSEAILRAAILVAVVMSLIMATVILLFGTPFFRLLGGTGEVLDTAEIYASRLFAGIVALWLFNMTASVLRGSGDTLRPAVGLSLILMVHAAVSWLLIVELGWGVAGAGLALPIAYAAGTVFLAGWVLVGRAAVQARWGTVAWSVLGPLLRQGGLAALQSTLTVAMALMVTAIVGRLGVHWLAGYGIGVRLEFLMIPIIFGIGGALIPMVGVNVGAGRRERAIRIAWAGVAVAVFAVGSFGLIFAVQPEWWSRLFTAEPETLAATALYLRIVGPFYGFFALGLCLYFASQGLDSLAWPVIGTALRLLLVVGGGLLLLAVDAASPAAIFSVVAGAMVVYGLFIAAALKLGPWRA